MATKDRIRDAFDRVRELAEEIGLLEYADIRLVEGGSRESGKPWRVVGTTPGTYRVTWLPRDGDLGYHKPTVLDRLESAERVLLRWSEGA